MKPPCQSISRLLSEQLAGAHAGSQRTENPWMPARVLALGGRDQMRGFLPRQRLNDGLGFVAAAQIATHTQARIRRQLVVFNGLRQQRAQRARDAFYGVQPKALLPVRGNHQRLFRLGEKSAGPAPGTRMEDN